MSSELPPYQPLVCMTLKMTGADKRTMRIGAAIEGVTMSEFLRRAGRERAAKLTKQVDQRGK